MKEINERRLTSLEALLMEYLEGQEGTPAAYLHQTLGYVRASLAGVRRKNADAAYSGEVRPELVREIILVEVLSEGGTGDADLPDIAEGIVNGPYSGAVQGLVHESVSPATMAGLLREQGSDPSFLLGEDGE